MESSAVAMFFLVPIRLVGMEQKIGRHRLAFHPDKLNGGDKGIQSSRRYGQPSVAPLRQRPVGTKLSEHNRLV
jgi:hypothetical protein